MEDGSRKHARLLGGEDDYYTVRVSSKYFVK